MNYSITITDTNNTKIGELPNATPTQIRKYLKKGLVVIDNNTGNIITEDTLNAVVGIAECVIDA